MAPIAGVDVTTSEHVWSSEIGYPGDPFYREFYRDLGYDLDEELIRPYLHSDGVRRNVGIKYHHIGAFGVPPSVLAAHPAGKVIVITHFVVSTSLLLHISSAPSGLPSGR